MVWLLLCLFSLFLLFLLLYTFPLFIPQFIFSTTATSGILKNAEIHFHEQIF